MTRAYATACCCNIIKCEDTLPTTTDDDSAMEVAGGESEGRRGEERVKTLVLLAVDILVTGDFENRSSRSVKVSFEWLLVFGLIVHLVLMKISMIV